MCEPFQVPAVGLECLVDLFAFLGFQMEVVRIATRCAAREPVFKEFDLSVRNVAPLDRVEERFADLAHVAVFRFLGADQLVREDDAVPDVGFAIEQIGRTKETSFASSKRKGSQS